MMGGGISEATLHPPFATATVPLGRPTVRLRSGGVNRLLVVVPLDRSRDGAFGVGTLGPQRTGLTRRGGTGILIRLPLLLVFPPRDP
jgi:hypothetical protein